VELHVVSNLVVAALVIGGLLALRAARRSDIWRGAGRELLRRRPIALAVVGVYLAVALLDAISWVGGAVAAEGGDQLAMHKPRSVIDRMFPVDFKERSYSGPLAQVEFYADFPLEHAGSHLLGTDILGRDVLHLTLKGARVALLIGGLTSLIVIPLDRRRGLLRDVRALLDPFAAAADRPHHGAGPRPGAGVHRHGRDELGRLLPGRARRDLQAPGARLRAGGPRARRLRVPRSPRRSWPGSASGSMAPGGR